MTKLAFEYCGPKYESSQFEGAGLSLRIIRHAFTFGALDYRERNSIWPKWLRFQFVLGGPRNPSMMPEGTRRWALYLFGYRIFDTLYAPTWRWGRNARSHWA